MALALLPAQPPAAQAVGESPDLAPATAPAA
jgi:hypothetical protein